MVMVAEWIQALGDSNPTVRQHALSHLAKYKNEYQDLGPLLWNSRLTIFQLLQEILSIYRSLSPEKLTLEASVRVCNALALLQCVACHPATKMPFLNAGIHQYLYPFLYTTITTDPFERLRLTSLGVIGALVKVDDSEIIKLLLSTADIIVGCLRSMDIGTEYSKRTANYILNKILSYELGLNIICFKEERFYSVCCVLEKMVDTLSKQKPPSFPLLKLIIFSYLALSRNPNACKAFYYWLPKALRDSTFIPYFGDDMQAKEWFIDLHNNVYGRN